MTAPEVDVEGLRLTGKGVAFLDTETRIAPCDVLSPEQYDAIRMGGLDVFFVRAESLLGGAE